MAARTHDEIAALMSTISRLGGSTPFGFFIDQDSKDPSRFVPHLAQAGISLPDRDYYLKKDNHRFNAASESTLAW